LEKIFLPPLVTTTLRPADEADADAEADDGADMEDAFDFEADAGGLSLPEKDASSSESLPKPEER
jgi:hypothetical protein